MKSVKASPGYLPAGEPEPAMCDKAHIENPSITALIARSGPGCSSPTRVLRPQQRPRPRPA